MDAACLNWGISLGRAIDQPCQEGFYIGWLNHAILSTLVLPLLKRPRITARYFHAAERGFLTAWKPDGHVPRTFANHVLVNLAVDVNFSHILQGADDCFRGFGQSAETSSLLLAETVWALLPTDGGLVLSHLTRHRERLRCLFEHHVQKIMDGEVDLISAQCIKGHLGKPHCEELVIYTVPFGECNDVAIHHRPSLSKLFRTLNMEFYKGFVIKGGVNHPQACVKKLLRYQNNP